MSWFQKLRTALLRPRPADSPTAAPRPQTLPSDDLPPFTLDAAELMQYDPQVRIGLGARNGLLLAAQMQIEASQPAVADFVRRTWDRIWRRANHHLLRAKLYGFLPLEATFRQVPSGPHAGLIEVADLRDHRPHDTRLLVQGDRTVGMVVRHNGGERRLFAPQALVCTFDGACDMHYGCALLARAYPAWYEKWCEGGAKRTLRLRMVKDAYIGDIVWYPPERQVQLADGRELSWREIARDLIEARQSGGALALPLLYDRDGRKLVDYTPPQAVPGHTQIFTWKRDLDLEIWKALEVPPEIIQASTSGSGFSGRWIPFVVAVSAVQQELGEIVRCVDRDLLGPLVQLNFGPRAQYEIAPRSLVEIYQEQFARGDRP